MNKYLLISGCSFTAGGGFNNPTIFELEFPNESIESYIKVGGDISWADNNFKNFLRPILWPSILGKLSNYTDSFNVSAGAKGIYTSINTLYHFIFDWQLQGKDVTELEIIYQIPSYNRLEIYINDDNKHKCIVTEYEDSNENKQIFITKFFNEEYNLLSSIHELYKLKKYCDALHIPTHFIPWDDMAFKEDFEKLKEKIKKYKDDLNFPQFSKFWTNIDEVVYYDVDLMLNELNLIYLNDTTINNYLESNFEGFYFESKYSDISNDRHMTKEGHQKYAETLKQILK